MKGSKTGTAEKKPRKDCRQTSTALLYFDEESHLIVVPNRPKVVTRIPEAMEVVEAIEYLGDGSPVCLLVDLGHSYPISREARAIFSGMTTDLLKAAALVVPTPLSRVLGNFFLKVANSNHPLKLFKNQTEAKEWLRAMENSSTSHQETGEVGSTAIEHALISLAQGDLDTQIDLEEIPSEQEAIASGINMLAEELSLKFQEVENLKTLKQRTELILNSAGEGIFGLDEDGRISFINPAATLILGYSCAKELVGLHYKKVLFETSGTTCSDDHTIQSVLDDGYMRTVDRAEFCRKDGKILPVDYLCSAIKNDSNDIEGAVVTFNDISKNLELQSQVAQSSRLASMGELAAGVGHEINNPLAIVMGNIDKIKMELRKAGIENPEIELAVDRQDQASDRIAKIVAALRNFARAEGDSSEKNMDVHGEIENVVSLIGEIFSKSGVKIDMDLRATHHTVFGNEGRFQQIVINLLTNAKDAIESRPEKHISIRSESDENNLIIFCSDNGTGIPDHIRDRVFDSFFTTKSVDRGTGLGLGICTKIIAEMQGRLSIESTSDQGTTFRISLPLANRANKPGLVGLEPAPKSVVSEPKPKNPEPQIAGRVLIVDDEEGIRDILRVSLEDMGLQVDEADDGVTALELIKQHKYDLVCTDIQMPKIPGDIFIQEAKKLPNGATKYIVITAGFTSDESEEKMKVLSGLAHGFLTKPFSYDSLCREVRKHWSPTLTKRVA